MPTASTIPLVVVALIVWRLAKGNLLAIVLFVSVFGAASALDIGDQGIAPWIFILAIGLWFKLVSGRLHVSIPTRANRKALLLMVLFVIYAVFSGISFPVAFKGVHVVAAHLLNGGALVFGNNNISQIFYLLACFTVFLLGLTGGYASLRSALDWYVYGCLVGAFFSVYQYLNAVAHIPYPASVLYSGHHAILTHTAVTEGAVRLNSTFDEVSALATHMTPGLVLVGWDLCKKAFRLERLAQFTAILAAILVSESSTAYLSLILALLALSVVAFHTYLSTHTISRAKMWALIGACTFGFAVITMTRVPSLATKTFQREVLDKDKSFSYKERTGWNVSAMNTAKETYFIGSGLGSVRCSSLEYGLLATVGAFGCAVFVAAIAMQFSPLLRETNMNLEDNLYSKALLAEFIVLAAMSVSGNEIVEPALWALFAAGVAGPSVLRPQLVLSWTQANRLGRLNVRDSKGLMT